MRKDWVGMSLLAPYGREMGWLYCYLFGILRCKEEDLAMTELDDQADEKFHTTQQY